MIKRSGVYKDIVFFVTFITVFIIVHTFKFKHQFMRDARRHKDYAKEFR